MARSLRLMPAGRGGAWLAINALLAGGSLLGWWLPAAGLDWQPGRALPEPWRFVTAAWVHWSPMHLAANLGAMALVAALGAVARLPTAAAVALVIAWPLTHAGLLLQPALAHYGGASGVLHAAVAVAAGWLMASRASHESEPRRRRERLIGAAIGLGLVLKVLLEEPWAGPIAAARSWDIAVAPLAHASGVIAGALCAAGAIGAVVVGSRRDSGSARSG